MKALLFPAAAAGVFVATAISGFGQEANDVVYSRRAPATRSQIMSGQVTPTASYRPVARPQQSAVQRQLQLMYQKQGREMPEMNLGQMPGSEGYQGAPQGTRPQPQFVSASGSPARPVADSRKRSFWSRMTPSFLRRKKDKERPVEDEEESAHPDDPLPGQPATGPKPPPGQRQIAEPGRFPAESNAEDLEEPFGPAPRMQQRPARTARQPRQARSMPAAESPALRQPQVPPPPRESELLDESAVLKDEESLSLDESLNTAAPARPRTPPAETSEHQPFSGLTINPAERETELADDPPRLASPKSLPTPDKKSDPPPAADPTPAASELPSIPAPSAEQVAETTDTKASVPDGMPTLDEPDPAEPPRIPVGSPTDGIPAPPEDKVDPSRTDSASPRNSTDRERIEGVKGYCLVTLKIDRKLVAGSDEFRSMYRGHVYCFATDEARDLFEKNPAAYAPAAGGTDVVKKSEGEPDIAGSLDHAVWYKGSLYMFSGEKTLNTFVASPAKYATAPKTADSRK